MRDIKPPTAITTMFHDLCADAAYHVVQHGELSHPVMKFMLRDGEQAAAIVEMPEDHSERDMMAATLRVYATAYDAVATCMTAEVWLNEEGKSGDERRSGLMSVLCWRHANAVHTEVAMWPLLMADGKVVGMDAEVISSSDGNKAEGRWVDVLPPRRPTNNQRKRALDLVQRAADAATARMMGDSPSEMVH